KGAIRADVGDLGIIPGSMGASSYIVAGKGNPLSWKSCSHGAGRRLSRAAAKRQYTAQDLAREMEGRTWLADRADALVDEIPSSSGVQVTADQTVFVEARPSRRLLLSYKVV